MAEKKLLLADTLEEKKKKKKKITFTAQEKKYELKCLKTPFEMSSCAFVEVECIMALYNKGRQTVLLSISTSTNGNPARSKLSQNNFTQTFLKLLLSYQSQEPVHCSINRRPAEDALVSVEQLGESAGSRVSLGTGALNDGKQASSLRLHG